MPIITLKTRCVSPTAETRATEICSKLQLTPCNWFAGLLLPALGKASQKFARTQSTVDLARIAIALERHHLAHGNFPETLDALAPQFMEKVPHDVIGGKPLHYRRTDDEQFVLYSIGWNEKDDGGNVVLTKEGKSVNWNQGDWVWRYPPPK